MARYPKGLKALKASNSSRVVFSFVCILRKLQKD